ncbi:hypothetical protein SMD20_27680 [Nonomuraea sp. LP-02]|uniref:hypothetical protein n=1 Tax=Nonomuraea sp. LP-02 TaxID=3097960 RepID=UPI002E3385C9|nr:hypothetical protein [Nonomuraea sp. LP-02]MED7928069.1 hypothetical protein [Nonomuraea sp. LP-02]
MRELVEIHHIRADENLSNMLVRQTEESRQHLRKWLADHGEARRSDVDDTLKQVYDLVAAAAPSRFPTTIKNAIETQQAAEKLTAQALLLTDRVQALEQAVQVLDKLDQIRGRGPELDKKLSQTQQKMEKINERKQQLDEEIAGAHDRQSKDTQAERAFTRAKKQLEQQEKKLETAKKSLESAAAQVGITPTAPAVEQARKAAASRLNELVSLQPTINATPLLRQLLTNIVGFLGESEDAGLGEQTIVSRLADATEVTVTALKTALQARITELDQQQPNSSAEQLDRNIEATRSHLSEMIELDSLLTAVDELTDAKAKARDKLAAAASKLPPTTARTLSDLLAQRNKLDDEASELQAQYARLEHAKELLGGGQTEDTLLADLIDICRSLDVEVSRVRGHLDAQSQELAEMTKRQATAEYDAVRARKAATDHSSQVTRVIRELAAPETAWLRVVVPEIDTLHEADHLRQSSVLEHVLELIERARQRLGSALGSILGVSGALGGTRELLESGEAASGSWNETVRLYLGSHVRRWFDNDRVRDALFGSGTNIFLDPVSMIVSWTNGKGEAQSRPLSAFSSGEQAFAFTRARMAQLDREAPTAMNRLIALDEFGSVIDRDGMAHLAQYLSDRCVEKPDEQVVVILPLREGTLELSRREAPARVRSLEDRGYFTEPLLLRSDSHHQ